MMNANSLIYRFLIFFSFFLLGIGFLIPTDATLWRTFVSEYFAFIAIFFLFIIFNFNRIHIPKIIIPLGFCAFIPLIQFFLGKVYLWTTAIISFFYLFAFFIAIIYSYNNQILNKSKLIIYLCITLIASGCISVIMVFSQWLNFYIPYLPTLELIGSRPYANFSQPNHLSTFLFMALIAVWYLYETNKIKPYFLVIISILLIFGIVLTQSRTAWIVFFTILLSYFYFKRTNALKMKTITIFSFLFIYILLVLNLQSINYFFSQILSFEVVTTRSALDRATSSYERLQIWEQAWNLVLEQPWFGYGWNQAGVSIIEKIDHFYLNLWYSSFHNIFLDLFLWVGVPLAIIITTFSLYFLYILFKNSHTKESNLALLMTLPILVHANLEYPLFYSYFLLPLALLFGIALADIEKINYFKINRYVIFVIIFCYFLALIFTWNEYVQSLEDQSKAKIIALERMEKTGKYIAEFNMENKYYILTTLEMHAEWVALNIYDKYAPDELQRFENFVKVNPSSYNLVKLAQIYFYNADLENAQKYLNIFNKLFDGNFTLEDLAKVGT